MGRVRKLNRKRKKREARKKLERRKKKHDVWIGIGRVRKLSTIIRCYYIE